MENKIYSSLDAAAATKVYKSIQIKGVDSENNSTEDFKFCLLFIYAMVFGLEELEYL